ncbi:hypothetical protein K0651_06615 [Ornithinimicrobium sp. Arc0846-15]|uniref:hypothetical protein n=1 Tax=Ornithinimicrobium sp. INDO-MA30-4 TaxID=2908651 RepID=UPI001C67A51D|nr:hypothetical protein [Ornithinimicrobium sp. INDO-MA30-4]MBW8172717.1 hypothetical protein [Ornithinimicrobium laminariae]UJH69757.1 hypothetical protein L0A91_10695 [Ornithinimicrobium sp. INDO-MA30-4]
MPAKIKQILLWALFIFLIYAVLTDPDRAADILQAVWDIIWGGVQNIAQFFRALMS